MCYSNAISSNVVQLAQSYKKGMALVPDHLLPIYFSSGFSLPLWPCITEKDDIICMNWGLVPSWYRGQAIHEIASKTLNARVETLQDKASFKHLIRSKRCIIPSTGFFEYQLNGNQKKPFFIYPKNAMFFHMAGLYDSWIHTGTRETYTGFTIVTTEANSLMAGIHNTKKRMPLLLNASEILSYLHGEIDFNSLHTLDEEGMCAHPVDKRIIMRSNHNVPEVQHLFNDNIGTQGVLF